MKTALIRDYMTPLPVHVAPDSSLSDAARIMRDNAIHHLPVLERGRLIGVVALHDAVLIESVSELDSEALTVEEAMTPDPYTVEPSELLRDVVAVMAAKRYRLTLIVDHEETIGVFTTTDALRALATLLK